jgi:hypothetical protein
LKNATAIAASDFENYVNSILRFACKVVHDGNQKGKPIKEKWTEMFHISFDKGILSSLTGMPRCEKTKKARILVAPKIDEMEKQIAILKKRVSPS